MRLCDGNNIHIETIDFSGEQLLGPGLVQAPDVDPRLRPQRERAAMWP